MRFALSLAAALVAGQAHALSLADSATMVWTDWTGWETVSGSSVPDQPNGFYAYGTMTTTTAIVDVTYYNANGVAGIQTGSASDADYWANTRSRTPETSPYTSVPNAALGSPGVANIPTGTDIVRLNRAGSQTLSFSQSIANPVFAFVSLNGNGYGFDQDFELLSASGSNIDGIGVDAAGYWGAGVNTRKEISGSEYQLVSSGGEPHGLLRFTGSFDEVSWRSLLSETWNGFTVGIQGTTEEVFPEDAVVPLPGAAWLLLGGLGTLALRRRA